MEWDNEDVLTTSKPYSLVEQEPATSINTTAVAASSATTLTPHHMALLAICLTTAAQQYLIDLDHPAIPAEDVSVLSGRCGESFETHNPCWVGTEC